MTPGRLFFQVANGIMLLLFVVAAAVQYNDPDSVLWIALYGAGAICCGLYLAGRLPTWLATVLTSIFAIGALYLLARRLGIGAFLDTTGQEMMGLMEETREMMGLFIMAAWTGLLVWRTHREQRAAASDPSERSPA